VNETNLESESVRPVEDIIAAVVMFALCGVIWWAAQDIAPPFFDPLGSAALPKALAVIISGLSSIILVRAVVSLGRQQPVTTTAFRSRPGIAFGVLAISMLYAGLMDYGLLGFRWATVFFIFAAGSLLGRFDRRTMVISGVLAVLLGFGCAYLFRHVFYIDLP
jgi:putative tricarboxylic transport membrane protein